MSSFKSSGDIQRKRVGQTAVSNNQSSSVTLNELANKARKYSVILNFSEEVKKKSYHFWSLLLCKKRCRVCRIQILEKNTIYYEIVN